MNFVMTLDDFVRPNYPRYDVNESKHLKYLKK